MRWCVGNPPAATNSRRSFGRLRAGPPASTVNAVAAGVFGVPCERGALLERIGFADGCTETFRFEFYCVLATSMAQSLCSVLH